MKRLLAVQLACAITLTGCATKPLPRKSLDCYRPLLQCGSRGAFSFQVSVGPDATVSDVVPTDPQASRQVKRAAKCLAAHPDELEKLIARSPETPPFTFEFAAGRMFCDHSLAEPMP